MQNKHLRLILGVDGEIILLHGFRKRQVYDEGEELREKLREMEREILQRCWKEKEKQLNSDRENIKEIRREKD